MHIRPESMLSCPGFFRCLCIGVCLLLSGCGRSAADKQEAQVQAALARLLQRHETALPGGDGLPGGLLRPHIIFEEVTTKKFVQFMGSRGESLVLDMPTLSLNADERKRAEVFFRPLHAKRQHLPNDEVIYNVDFGNDTKRAAQVALRVFREVYGLPDGFRLRIEGE